MGVREMIRAVVQPRSQTDRLDRIEQRMDEVDQGRKAADAALDRVEVRLRRLEARADLRRRTTERGPGS